MFRSTALALAGLLCLSAFAHAQPGVAPDRAILVVRLPAAASLTVGGQPTVTQGPERSFLTPPIVPGFTYTYVVEARWHDGARDHRVTREVRFQPGQTMIVDLTVGGATPVAELKTRTFDFTYAGKVKDLPPGKEARVWIPKAVSNAQQDVEQLAAKLPQPYQTGKDKTYGNEMLSFVGKANDQGEIPFEVTYRVKRKEVKTDIQRNVVLKPAKDEKIDRFFQPDARVPTEGKPLELLSENLKGKPLPGDQFAAAKMMYDVVNKYMTYKKVGTGWGQGDVLWACDSKYGNCSDFHSLFIAMARGNKIASKFEMGFPIPTKAGSGTIGGYHCWAWFLVKDKGWVPVDISEANRNPEMAEYYFGNLTADRVAFSTGRDITLEPRQSGPPLNFFIYPYVEVDGKTYPAEKVERAFSYKDVGK